MRYQALFAALTALLLTLSVAEARSRGLNVETRYTQDGWLAELGGRGAEVATDVVPAADGGVYVVGNIERRGEARGFVARIGANGQLVWKDVVRGADGMTLQQAAFDPVRNRLLVVGVEDARARGRRRGKIQKLVVGAYTPRGRQLWRKSVEKGSFSRNLAAVDVATDKRGNLYVVGKTTGHFAGHRAAGAGADIFMAKFDRRGRTLWTKLLGAEDHRWRGVANDVVTALAIPPNGGLVYVTGVTAGDMLSGRKLRVKRSFEMQVHPTGRVMRVNYGNANSPVVDLAFDRRGNKYTLSNMRGYQGARTTLTMTGPRGRAVWSEVVGKNDPNAQLAVEGRRIYVTAKGRRGLTLSTFNKRGKRLDRERLNQAGNGRVALAVQHGKVFVAGNSASRGWTDAFVEATRPNPRGPSWLPVPQETAGYRPDTPPPVRDQRRGRGHGRRG